MNEDVTLAIVAGVFGAGGTLLGVFLQGCIEHLKTRGSVRRCNLDRLSEKQFEFYARMAALTSTLDTWALTLYSDVHRKAIGRPPVERPEGPPLGTLLKELGYCIEVNSMFIPSIVVDSLRDLYMTGNECMNDLSHETADKFTVRCWDARNTMRKCIGVDRLHTDLMRSLRERDIAIKSGPLMQNISQPTLDPPERPI